MKYIKKTWIRVLVSLLGGGMVTEFIYISTGDPNRPMTNNPSLLYGILIFGILTLVVNNSNRTTQ